MSKSDELTRKEMKEPDTFQAKAGEAAAWAAGHRQKVITWVVAVLVVAVAVAGVAGWRERRAAESGALLAKVYQAAGGTISSVPLPGQLGPFFPSETARQRAVVAAADELLARYGGTEPATLGRLARADALLRLGEWEQARAGYQDYLSAASSGDALRGAGLLGLAFAEEGKGNVDGALAALGRLSAEVPAQADRADLEKARLLAGAGKVAEAKALLSGFAQAHKDSPLGADASERLARLDGK